ncbi:GH1 family beta-glucosidase [Pararhodonellum marinum]|uniref:GH1 family beta-glucosidase n=1 Tax=Pararhodonellum marinum TaxID=2755358 RepID=UPI00188F3C88|nr:GH1 family beta-glucosidase [Pararhodonellum marinum]
MKSKNETSRRDFIKLGGTATLGLSTLHLTGCKEGETENVAKSASNQKGNRRFPDDFVWGTATAAYQVEGAVKEDGRGMSIWDTYSEIPGKIKNNDTGEVACDMYHRYKEDVQLMKSIHAGAYRFSISWPRVFPEGMGTPNPKGLDFYDRLIDELLANGITPYATLYHWDLPQTLQDKYGGWQSKETSKAFAAYAAYVTEKISDRVKHYFTLNEFYSFTDLSYGQGQLAPGLKLPQKGIVQVRHNAVLAHGMAVEAMRQSAKSPLEIGVAENIVTAVPVMDTRENIEAAKNATRELNAGLLTVMLEGKYTDKYLNSLGSDAPEFTDEELKLIGSPLDFVGINVYLANKYVLAADNEDGYELLPHAKHHPTMASPWHLISPESLYWAPRLVKELWNAKEIYITENGCGATDEMTNDGKIIDTDRVMFMKNYLTQLHRATSEGIPVKGYFHWSLMDNFEWIFGYGIRFGLFYMDYETLERTPKQSAAYFKNIAKSNTLI